jgi:hypothetical protein
MKRVLALPAVVLLLSTAACSEPEVVAEAAIVQPGSGETVALAELPIRLLPYDRDAIFDSLTAEAETPEPEIPAVLQQQRNEVIAAQETHAELEARWGTIRDSLRVFSETTQRMQQQGLRGTPQYRQAFEQFNRLEPQEGRVKQQADQAFARFEQLQAATLAQSDSVRVARETWAEEAFRDFDSIVTAKLEAMGREEFADTTNAAGVARFRVPEGQWWVYGRYTLPYEELYWNIPIEVTGDSTYIRLNEENAQRRPIL